MAKLQIPSADPHRADPPQILQILAMYAVHVLVTKGVVVREITRRKRGGQFEMKKLEAFHPILGGMTRLFGAAVEQPGNHQKVTSL